MPYGQGKDAEEVVADWLIKRGYRILAKNVVFPFAELDIVAQIKNTLVFVEVKYRKSVEFGAPYEAVDKRKQRKIILAAEAYMQGQKNDMDSRFDVVSLSGDLKNPQIDHIENAFFESW
jgi:putative endonuclease